MTEKEKVSSLIPDTSYVNELNWNKPERLKGESFELYKERQKRSKKAVDHYLRGKLLHQSRGWREKEITTVPSEGKEEKKIELIPWSKTYRKPKDV